MDSVSREERAYFERGVITVDSGKLEPAIASMVQRGSEQNEIEERRFKNVLCGDNDNNDDNDINNNDRNINSDNEADIGGCDNGTSVDNDDVVVVAANDGDIDSDGGDISDDDGGDGDNKW
eukprot:XP_014624101.1 prostatic spermine-binding protein-like [Glycine max]